MNRHRPSPLPHRASAPMVITLAVTVALALLTGSAFAGDTTPAAQLQRWNTQVGAACHTGADQGDFDEGRLRFPAGLDDRHRRAFMD